MFMAIFHGAEEVRENPDLAVQKAWQRESQEMRQQLGVSSECRPWTGRASFQGLGLPKTDRILDLLDLFTIKRCKDANHSLRDNLEEFMAGQYMDVSQSLHRKAHTNAQGCNHALTTSSLLYSFTRDSVVTGRELLLFHGQPRSLSLPVDMAESQIMQLAGEGMTIPSLASVLWCVFLCRQFPDVPWHETKSGGLKKRKRFAV